MTELKFRNINVSPDDPVEKWGVEGILTCLERGHLHYWKKLAAALAEDTSGKIKSETITALSLIENPSGIANVFAKLTC
jgi:hypothetical protein